MPYIDVKLVGKLSDDAKRAIAKDISTTLAVNAGKNKDACYISFTEFDDDSFAKGEKLAKDLKRENDCKK